MPPSRQDLALWTWSAERWILPQKESESLEHSKQDSQVTRHKTPLTKNLLF